ncbi:hypothetical protein TNIN_233471 [Trichonephila inaurata madagascariensis]|uniref:Uncharacterized protein n=1 Tax=Trichonephila inaurata madagascariensis TaxID=2747483 RepID=A0A8X6YBA0_9ARAC|nr:hypothetical protein TNIN_233471 [Trichonephila inaurata madagascariensis]
MDVKMEVYEETYQPKSEEKYFNEKELDMKKEKIDSVEEDFDLDNSSLSRTGYANNDLYSRDPAINPVLILKGRAKSLLKDLNEHHQHLLAVQKVFKFIYKEHKKVYRDFGLSPKVEKRSIAGEFC